MKILIAHNYYQQRGGEDQSFEDEAALLESHGHEVVRHTVHNDVINSMSRLGVAWRTLWNGRTYRELRQLIQRERPAVMHCTNTFPLLSPAAYDAAHAEGVPVVQSVRNYRWLCPGALFLRDGKVCEDCLGRSIAWPGVWHGCYRNSRAATAVVAAALALQRLRQTWDRRVDVHFTLTEFAKQKLIQGGVPAGKIMVKPNFLQTDPGQGSGRGGYAVFAGRLSPEKGLDTLLDAWERLDRQSIRLPLKIVGDGPMRDRVQAAANANPAIEWMGRRSLAETLSIIGEAAFLVMPSICYETFGRTIVEAFAKGTPVLVSSLGAMAELVEDGRTGLRFAPGDAADLAEKVQILLSDTGQRCAMGQAARAEFLSKYTPEKNYEILMTIYQRALSRGGSEPTDGATPNPTHSTEPSRSGLPPVAVPA